MNKTISINIGGRIFNIEEDAYRRLDIYLRTLKAYFDTRDSGEEIIADIEARIAELFDERITPAKQVILVRDVDEIIAIMGRPEDYMDADPDVDEEEEKADSARHHRTQTHRRVYRDPDDKVIFGVCSGISAYLGWDPIILRAIFVAALLLYGTGPLLYVILAIIIPKAKTTAEKLRMRGEPVNVDNISKKVRESFAGMKEDVNEFGKRHQGTKEDVKNFGHRIGDLFADFFEGLGRVLKDVFRVLAKLIGAAFLITGILGVFALVAAVFGIDGFFVFNHNGMGMEDQLDLWLGAVATGPKQITMFFTGAVAVLAVPIIGLMMAGIRLLFGYRGFSPIAAVVLIVVFFIGLGLLAAVGINISRDFAVETTLTERVSPPLAASDTLVIDAMEPFGKGLRVSVKFDDRRFFYSGAVTFPGVDSTNILFYGENQFTIDDRPRGNEYQLRIERSSRGGSQKRAMENAEKIRGKYELTSDSLRIYPYYALLKGAKIRSPKLKYTLSMPVGATVYFAPAADDFIYDVPNVTNTYDSDMVGHYWRMTDRGLECTDCSASFFERTRRD